jgi:biotin transport system permease protein/energy-coupling factor transport system permease protein
MLKLFLLLPLSIFCMSLSSFWLSVGILFAAITVFLCRFSLREQLTDLKPAAFYAVMMYGLSVFSNLFENWHDFIPPAFIASVFIPRPDFLRIALRLVLIVQLSAMLFRSTSSMEIRESLFTIEHLLKRFLSRLPFFGKRISPRHGFAETISLFLCFIPEIFASWSVINMAWKARGGKQGFEKIKTVVFVLLSLCMEKAAVKAKALSARG